MSESGLVKALCPIVGDAPCSWVNTLMKYVFSSFTLSSSVSVIEPSFLFRWGTSPVVFSLLVTYLKKKDWF